MSVMDFLEKIIIPIIAAFIGAFIAFRYQNNAEAKKNKLYILSTLMANRHMGAWDDDFVKALNLIDIIYHDNKNVKEHLHKYFEVTRGSIFTPGERINVFFDLLLAMCEDVGYKDLKRSDINDFYSPERPTLKESNEG